MRRSAAPTTNLIVPLVSGDPSLRHQIDHAIERGADLVELRVDLIGDVAAVEDLLHCPRSISYILTIRSAEEGGGWDRSEDERIALFERLGSLLPGYIDVEFAAWTRSAELRRKIGPICDIGSTESKERAKSKLILSHHDFRRTPSERELNVLLESMKKVPAAIYKIACYAAEASDGLRLLSFAGFGPANVAMMGMAEGGICTRIAARRLNLWGTYAALESGSESAPGQPSIDAIQNLFRWKTITQETQFYGVAGWPVSHSRSPAIHNAAMAADGINGVYMPMPTKPKSESFQALMDQMNFVAGRSFCGFSVTIPHKENAFRWLNDNGFEISAIARRAGAVNTLIRKNESIWTGENTDAKAAWDLIKNNVTNIRDRRILVVGAGGVARAIVAALIENGIEPMICNRTDDRTIRLKEDVGGRVHSWSDRVNLNADVIVNCTSVGMTPKVDESPFPAESLHDDMVVFETVYTPASTRLLQDARAAGCKTIDGTELFLRQAALQYELWHGRSAPIAVMRAAVTDPPRQTSS